jgi:SAM-dependent methyltransferase
MAATEHIPLPPPELAHRVGSRVDAGYAEYLAKGAEGADVLRRALPADRPLAGARMLDFGCGAGRILRHLLDVPGAWLVGCDIDEASIAWVRRHLPQVEAFVNEEWPPLALSDGAVDVVFAASVFTHLADSWSAWLLEVHRVLDDGGVLVASFLGPGMSEEIAGEPWDENRIGMNVLRPGNAWEHGGPMVLHSPWWLREHWGRAFEVLALDPLGFPPHGLIVLRRRGVPPSIDELERLPSDPRELIALRHNVAQLEAEAARGLGPPTAVEAARERLRTAEERSQR